jgi:uncharacterized protein involved in response to NO
MPRPLVLLGASPESSSRPRWALASKGFRPFFLLAAIFASTIVPAWILVLAGLARAAGYVDATSWHAHEMVLGFTVAVIAGFLLTAVGNWTQRETLVGGPLLGLSILWVLGRLAMLFGGVIPRALVALVDLAFLPALIVVLARPLIAAKNRRNFVMLGVLGALFAANVIVHLEALGLAPHGAAQHAVFVAVDVVAVVILLIAGRVFPMFTRNATGRTTIRSTPALDLVTVAAMSALTVIDAIAPESPAGAAAAGCVGVLSLARAARWGTWHTARHPLLWILHAGYAWLALGLVLRALARVVPAIPTSIATHAITVGAIGSLTLGMMARVSLGHTGRPLVTPRPVTWAFGAITAAAVSRVIAPLVAPRWYFPELAAAGALWTLAFLLFLWAYGGVLVSPRADGRPG